MSFLSVNAFKRALSKIKVTLDFNIGTDDFHTPQNLIAFSKDYFENLGYTLGINSPYKDTLVPKEHCHTNKKVQAIMLEVNRRLYLNEPSNEKSDNFETTKKVVQGFLEGIRKILTKKKDNYFLKMSKTVKYN